MLLAGWALALAAVALLAGTGPRGPFLMAGLGVEALGLALAVRSHMTPKDEGS